MTRTRVKICGITSISDAQQAVAAGADALGLVFYPNSPRYLDPSRAREVALQVPGFVTLVGLFVDPDPQWVRDICGQVPLDLLQFHGDEPNDFCASFGKRFIKALRVKPGMALQAAVGHYPDACGVLLDSYVAGVPGGTGVSFDWDLIPRDLGKPLILAGGLNADNVAEAIARVAPFAVDVSGGVERAKGIKDHSKIHQFVGEVRRGDSIR